MSRRTVHHTYVLSLGRGLQNVLLASVLISSILLLTACEDDLRESFYPALLDAKKAGEIDRGWIPDYLPDSSNSIRIAYRTSHPRTWCEFAFINSDSGQFRKNIMNGGALPRSVLNIQRPALSWWPEVLQGELSQAKIHAAGLELYVHIEPGRVPALPDERYVYLFAIDWQKRMGFFYQTVDHEGRQIPASLRKP